MIEKIAKFSLNARSTILVITALVIGVGIWALSSLPIDAVPDITNVQVVVNTKTGALAPEEIERSITFPIETQLFGLPGVEDIRSISKYGLSQVTIIFQDGTDIYRARQRVSERLQNVRDELPEGIAPMLGPISTGLGEVLMYVVLAKPGTTLAKKNAEERLRYLRTIQDWRIKPFLKSVRGIEEVDSNGGYVRNIQIGLNPVAMVQNGISMDRLMDALNNAGMNTGGGYIENAGERSIVRSIGRFQNFDQIKHIPVQLYALEAPIQLQSFASIHEGSELRVGAASFEGEETVLGTVLMRIGENSRIVATEAETRLKEIDLPSEVEVRVVYSRSKLVNATVRTVAKNLLEAAVLVIVVLLATLGNLRAALIVAIAIPVSMLVSFTGMVYSGISANLMSLGAIDFGLLVDGSVVLIESVMQKIEHSKERSPSKEERFRFITDSAREVGPPIVSGMLIIMIVYIPVLMLSGIEGKLFRPMALTVLMALGASLIVAIVLMPILAYLVLRANPGKEGTFFLKVLNRIYRPFLEFAIKRRFVVIVPSMAILLLASFLFFRMGFDFMPPLDEGDAVIGVSIQPQASLAESLAKQKKIQEQILKIPEVKTIFSRTGTPESATDPMGVNFTDTFVILKSKDEIEESLHSKHDKETIVREIKETAEKVDPESEISPSQPIEMRFNEMMEGSRADVSFRIFGPDLKTLMRLIDESQKVFEKISGVEEVGVDELTALRSSPVVDFQIQHSRVSAYGLHVHNVNESFEAAMAGKQIGYFYEDIFRIPIVLRIDDRFRSDVASISRLPIDVPGGGSVPLSELARMEKTNQITTISHFNARRYASVAIFLGGRDLASFVTEARERIARDVPMPDGYSIQWGGQFTHLEKARLRLLLVVPVALLLIFFILLKTFGSIAQTLLILLCIPFAITGGIFSLFLREIPMSVSASVGFIALSGIAVLNGAVLVSHFNDLRKKAMPLDSLIISGAIDRLRPVLITALVAGLGFVPMALNTGMGAEVQRPLATVVIGGLVSSTLLTLVILPLIYGWIEKRKQ